MLPIEYGAFLQNIFPLMVASMNQKTKPQVCYDFFTRFGTSNLLTSNSFCILFHMNQLVDNEENKFRTAVLDIVYRLPTNEVLKPFVEGFLNMVMAVRILLALPNFHLPG